MYKRQGLPEGRDDRILDGLTEEIALLGDEPQMVVVARFPIDGAADLVQIELAAEDGVPPLSLIHILTVAAYPPCHVSTFLVVVSLLSAAFAANDSSKEGNSDVFVCIGPVSYTHLDVYKRQREPRV